MNRSYRKGPYINNHFSKNSIIPSFLINKTVVLHNGNTFEEVTITSSMVGFKLGEFIKTRKPFKYKK
jgi:ribosomal protein S19